ANSVTVTMKKAVKDTAVCHKCHCITLHPSPPAAAKAKARHDNGECDHIRTNQADHDRYSAEKLRDREASAIGHAIREYLAPTCIAVPTSERVVVCKQCDKVLLYDAENYKAAVLYHKHAPGAAPGPPQVGQLGPCHKVWRQALRNWTDQVSFALTCGYCHHSLQYSKLDKTAALAHHYGRLCQNPCLLRGAPTPTTDDEIGETTARDWEAAMNDVAAAAKAALDTAMDMDTMSPTNAPLHGKRSREEDTPSTPSKSRRSTIASSGIDSACNSDEEKEHAEPQLTAASQGPTPMVSAPHTTTPTHRGKPPPIVVDSDWGEDFFQKLDKYNEGLTKPFTAKLAGGAQSPQLVLRTQSLDDYHTLITSLREAKEPFTTATPRAERQERIVATRVPTAVPAERIHQEVSQLGLPILTATRVVVADRKGGARALDKVLCTFPAGTNVKEIISNVKFEVRDIPLLELADACWKFYENTKNLSPTDKLRAIADFTIYLSE
ncbi:Putative trans-acting regulator pXO2-62/BXB0076, partial [Frankliniella fusca]